MTGLARALSKGQNVQCLATTDLLDGLARGLPGLLGVAAEDAGQSVLAEGSAGVPGLEEIAARRVGLDQLYPNFAKRSSLVTNSYLETG
jgi:hypothetical protein